MVDNPKSIPIHPSEPRFVDSPTQPLVTYYIWNMTTTANLVDGMVWVLIEVRTFPNHHFRRNLDGTKLLNILRLSFNRIQQ